MWDVDAGGSRGIALALVAAALVMAFSVAETRSTVPVHEHLAFAVDGTFAQEAGRVTTRQNTTPPTTTHILIGDQGTAQWYISAVQVILTATDDVGVASTQYRVNDESFQTYVSQFSIDLEGTNRVDYFSIDTDGNVESPKSVGIPIDRTPPAIVDITPTRLESSGLVAITWNATDATSGIESYDLSIDSGQYVSLGKQESRTVPLSDGAHTIRVRAWDAAGLSFESEVSFQVDSSPVRIAGPQSSLPFIVVFGGNAALVIVVLLVRRRKRR